MAGPVLKGRFDLDGSGFKKSMDDIKSSAKKSVKEIENMGGSGGGGLLMRAFGVVGALVGLKEVDATIDALIQKLKKLRDSSAQTGFDAETLQRIGNVGDVEAATKGLEAIAEAQERILGGGDKDLKLTEAFARLGVSLNDLKPKKHQAIFLQIAEAMKEAEASAENINDLSAVMGGKGPDLMPMFRRGLDSAEAHAGVVSNDDVAEINRLNDEAIKATAPIKSFWEQLKAEAAALKLKGKIGIGQLADFPIGMETANFDEVRGERIRKRGAERLAARDRERAQLQAQAEADRIAKEEEAARRAALIQKASEIGDKQRRSILQKHIQGLETARSRVGEDLSRLQSGRPNAAQIKSSEGMNPQELVRLSQAIVAEIQKSNMELQKLNSKRPAEESMF